MPMGEIDADRTDQYLPLSLCALGLSSASRSTMSLTSPVGWRAYARRLDRRQTRLHHASHS
jgi:hypothetical protein